MRTNPITDSLLFMVGDTPDHHALGAGGYVLAALFALLLLASIAIAITCWREDPAQHRAGVLWLWMTRVLMGAMWFQGSLWKLPLPVSGGLKYWTEQLRDNSAFALHRAIVADFLLPNLTWLGPIVWLTETSMTIALVLGLAVRAAGVVGILFTLNLWIGLYRNGGEWPWTYVFIIFIEGLLVTNRAGYALGLDALLGRRTLPRFLAPVHRVVA